MLTISVDCVYCPVLKIFHSVCVLNVIRASVRSNEADQINCNGELQMQIIKIFPLIVLIFGVLVFQGCSGIAGKSSANHEVATLAMLESLTDSEINDAKSKLVIAYGHTSHGSQVIDGLTGLVAFMNSRGRTTDLYDGLVDHDYYGDFGGSIAQDLGNPDYTAWEAATRTYLDANPEVNVIVWSWCGQADTSEANIAQYLSLMNGLETDYPGVVFVYMTGHLVGTGLEGNLHLRNEQIRTYCRDNNKVLFDFADIESYDPDGNYYGDRHATDACNYDYDNDGTTSQTGDPAVPTGNDRNWALDWQGDHAEGIDWYTCGAAHSYPVNANMKAYAFWYLMVQIAKGM